MACQKLFPFNLKANDVALDQAIYSSAQDKIYGCRGQWVFQFNATTGAKEKEFRFINGAVGESSITELGGKLYLAIWRAVIWQESDSPEAPPADIYQVNYGLTASVATGIVTYANTYSTRTWEYGFTNIGTDGALLYANSRNSGAFVKFDPADVAGSYAIVSAIGQGAVDPMADLVVDIPNGVVWYTNFFGPDVWCIDVHYKNHNNVGNTFLSQHTTPSNLEGVIGLCNVPGTNKIYAVRGTNEIYKVNGNEALPIGAGANMTWSSLFILEADAKPAKIKYQPNGSAPYAGKVFVPTWSHDTVEILDPNTDTIAAVKTGFNNPFDVVFTPTKAWAVQNSGQGLKEITTT